MAKARGKKTTAPRKGPVPTSTGPARTGQGQGVKSTSHGQDVPLLAPPLTLKDIPDGSDPANPVRVYADGIYDMFHFGHARALEQAKKLFPNTYLLVGCCSDSMTHSYKGMTVFSDVERYESLRHCRWVDEVITDAPWVVTQEFLDKHNIHYVAHDALPYSDATGQANDVYDFVKKMGRFKETKRTEGISTSDIILRIIRNYNDFVLRNLKRGYSRKDLGVSYLKEQRIRASNDMKQLGKRFKEQRLKVTDRVKKRVAGVTVLPRRITVTASQFTEACEAALVRVWTGELGTEIAHNLEVTVQGVYRNVKTAIERSLQPLALN
ncbi:uncharacterized protein LOC142356437 [Convolutriloba macropyga]|uniref:uncharacterized protein LOC142356437 n=1 Tax=Convolutriloba macropyga TaxID=536237 RepID=UPI003F527F22